MIPDPSLASSGLIAKTYDELVCEDGSISLRIQSGFRVSDLSHWSLPDRAALAWEIGVPLEPGLQKIPAGTRIGPDWWAFVNEYSEVICPPSDGGWTGIVAWNEAMKQYAIYYKGRADPYNWNAVAPRRPEDPRDGRKHAKVVSFLIPFGMRG
jgi:hypothetical protein